MTQENKELVFRDLCARLPYGVKCYKSTYKIDFPEKVVCVINNSNHYCVQLGIYKYKLEHIKPYLFPLSSMTEEQSMELFKLFGISLVDSIDSDYIKINECTGITFFLDKGFDVESHLDKLVDWLNKNHFDYRGLIPMGLAIDATNLNIY